MEKFVKTFDGGINRDTEELFFPKEDWSDALDFDPGPGDVGQFKSGSGQGMIIPAAIYSQSGEKVVGYAEDRENETVYYLVSASTPKIVGYRKSDGQHFVLCSGAALGFNDNTIINGATVIDRHLIWNDATELVGHIYIPAMLEGRYTSPVVNSEIRLVKRPPNFPLICRLSVQSDMPLNFISTDSFVFSYRYEYDTGMMSVCAPWSSPVYRKPDYVLDAFNRIDILADEREVPPATVVNVQLLVMRQADSGFFIFKQMTRAEFMGTFGSTSPSTPAESASNEEVM